MICRRRINEGMKNRESIESCCTSNPLVTGEGMKTHTKSERFLIVHMDEDIKLITSRIERLYVKNGVFRMKGVDDWGFGELPALEELVIGNECFPFVRDFRLVGLKNLKKLEIGKKCFSEMKGGMFEVKDCDRIRSVRIGDGCFVNEAFISFESVKRVWRIMSRSTRTGIDCSGRERVFGGKEAGDAKQGMRCEMMSRLEHAERMSRKEGCFRECAGRGVRGRAATSNVFPSHCIQAC